MRPIQSIRRSIIQRLVIVWAMLSLGVGGASLYFEFQRHERTILGQAVSDTQPLLPHLGGVGAAHRAILNDVLPILLQKGFLSVQVIDMTGQTIAQAARPGQLGRFHPLTGGSVLPTGIHSLGEQWFSDEWIVQIMLPLQSPSGITIAHFYGSFQVDDATRAQAQWELLRNVSVVLLAMLGATVVLYPFILGLSKGVFRLSEDLMRSNMELMEVLGGAIAKRDSDTDLHNYRVCLYCIRFAQALGWKEDDIRTVIVGAFLHDVGKIGISDTILLKPGPLSTEEFAAMKTHVQIGVDIVAKSAWLKDARDVIEFHHERFDGSGYLQGLSGDSIPFVARLFAIIDVFDALTSRRPYKEPFPVEQALAILVEARGSHFDPYLLDVFIGIAWVMHAEISELAEHQLRRNLQSLVAAYFSVEA